MKRDFLIERWPAWVWDLRGLFGIAGISLSLYSRWVNSVFFACSPALPLQSFLVQQNVGDLALGKVDHKSVRAQDVTLSPVLSDSRRKKFDKT